MDIQCAKGPTFIHEHLSTEHQLYMQGTGLDPGDMKNQNDPNPQRTPKGLSLNRSPSHSVHGGVGGVVVQARVIPPKSFIAQS